MKKKALQSDPITRRELGMLLELIDLKFKETEHSFGVDHSDKIESLTRRLTAVSRGVPTPKKPYNPVDNEDW